MIGARNTISASQGAVVLRGTDQQVGDNLLAQAPRAQGGGLWPTASQGMSIDKFGLNQRAGAADLTVGIGFRLVNRSWKFFTEDDDVYTDDTDDAQSSVANSVALGTDGDDAGGFVIMSSRKFNWVSVNVTTASTAGEKTSIVQLSNAAGTGWTTIPAGTAWIDDLTVTAGAWSTGENIIAFPAPTFWGKVTSLNGLPDNMYALSVTSSTEATAAGLAGGIEVGTIVSAREDVDDNGTFGEEECAYWEPEADAIVAMFSTGAAGNFVTAEWVHRG